MVDRFGHPVQSDVGEQFVPREAPRDITIAVAPPAELLDDPRGKASRRIVESQRQRLWLRALDHRVRALVLPELGDRLEILLFPGAGIVRWLQRVEEGNIGQMDAGDRIAMVPRE